ncbi:MAG: thioredoxin fold domain-containing protein [Gammaproteobacteria bacterium]|nr:thioredoxin fold domain-containing protein [Gammaproteobacteria bacterium]
MKQAVTLLGIVLLSLSTMLHAAEENENLGEGMVNPGYHEPPTWFKNSFMDLQEDLAEARESGKRLLIYFYQDGCPYCGKLLSVNWTMPDIVKATRDNFDVIAINLWGDREVTDFTGNTMSEKRFAEKNRVMYTPTLLFFDEQGELVLRVNGYYPPKKFAAALDYVAGKNEDRLAFSEFYREESNSKANKSLHRQSSYLDKPYKLTPEAREGKRPLLVLFEQRWCDPCDELHEDIFKRDETQKYLQKFDIVLLDRWSKEPVVTPGGEKTTAMEWAKELKVNYAPSMILFDKEGKEVFRTEAYLKSFHVQSVLDYVSSEAYKEQPNLQRYIQARADRLHEQGIEVDLMN